MGAPGRTIYEPVLVASHGDDIYIEAHPDMYRRVMLPGVDQLRALTDAAAMTSRIDWEDAHEILRRTEGIARVVRPSSGGTGGTAPAGVARASADSGAGTPSAGCGP